LTEAQRCLASGFYIASALVGRRALQSAVRSQLVAFSLSPPSARLVDEIKTLPDGVLSPQWRAAADMVRYIGNDAAHSDPISKEAAESLLDFTIGVFEQVFELPHRLAAATAAREQKQPGTP
jgi:hypothetical protein